MKKNITHLYVAFALICFVVSSCNKDNQNFNAAKAPTTVELPLAAYTGPAAYDTGGFIYAVNDSINAAPEPIVTVIHLTGSSPLSKPVNVTLTVDNAALTKLNAAHKALYLVDSTTAVSTTSALPNPGDPKYLAYEALPANAYTTQSLTATIAAGLTNGSVTFNIITGNLVFGNAYALPVTITDAQGQAISYYKSLYYTIGLQADCTANGSISFPDPSSNRSWVKRDKVLTSVGNQTVRAEAADLGGSNYYMYLTIHSDNTVTVKSAPDAANLTIQNNGPCTYNPTTKIFTLNYLYVGGTGNRVISETIQRNN